MRIEQKVTFINPNSRQDIEKSLPKILASAIISKLQRDQQKPNTQVQHTA